MQTEETVTIENPIPDNASDLPTTIDTGLDWSQVRYGFSPFQRIDVRDRFTGYVIARDENGKPRFETDYFDEKGNPLPLRVGRGYIEPGVLTPFRNATFFVRDFLRDYKNPTNSMGKSTLDGTARPGMIPPQPFMRAELKYAFHIAEELREAYGTENNLWGFIIADSLTGIDEPLAAPIFQCVLPQLALGRSIYLHSERIPVIPRAIEYLQNVSPVNIEKIFEGSKQRRGETAERLRKELLKSFDQAATYARLTTRESGNEVSAWKGGHPGHKAGYDKNDFRCFVALSEEVPLDVAERRPLNKTGLDDMATEHLKQIAENTSQTPLLLAKLAELEEQNRKRDEEAAELRAQVQMLLVAQQEGGGGRRRSA